MGKIDTLLLLAARDLVGTGAEYKARVQHVLERKIKPQDGVPIERMVDLSSGDWMSKVDTWVDDKLAFTITPPLSNGTAELLSYLSEAGYDPNVVARNLGCGRTEVTHKLVRALNEVRAHR